MTIRQPIVTLAGHVDHGKTSILDSIRTSAVAEAEAGGITQKISFTLFPADKIKQRCSLLEKSNYKLEIPGFLFIDTPGHAAFSNLRKRGGSLADLAVLVIDINEGIKPQTAEVIEILKLNKTPFIIALNKIDNISGWSKQSNNLKESIQNQAQHAKQDFNEKIITFQSSLYSHGFNSDIYYNVHDFSTKIALVPCSAKTGEGISELLLMLCGLSQKFLKGRLSLGKEAKGVILEIKKQKDMQYIEAILYDGSLSAKKEIAISSFGEPVTGKIRILEEILPFSNKFKPTNQATAATGIRMQLTQQIKVLPGMPFQILNNNLEQIKQEFQKQIHEKFHTNSSGIIIKADSLGSLEALITLLKQENIKILKADIGKINKTDLISAQANAETNPEQAVILGFNVQEDDETKSIDKREVKIITDDVIYKLIENLQEFQKQKRDEIKKKKLMSLATICKLKILHQHIFRNSNPAIFGVAVEAGKLTPNTPLINEQGQAISKVKKIQEENATIEKAEQGKEVAISLPNTNFERQLAETDYLYSDITESQFKQFKKNKTLLSQNEIQVLQKIAEIKRREKVGWGV